MCWVLDPAVAGLAIALDDAAGAPVDRAGFVDRLLAEVERWIDRHVAGGVPAIAEAWRARMAPGLTGRAMVGGRIVTGALHGLAPDGALQLRDERGAIHDVRSGDVEVIRPAPDRADDAGVLHPAG